MREKGKAVKEECVTMLQIKLERLQYLSEAFYVQYNTFPRRETDHRGNTSR